MNKRVLHIASLMVALSVGSAVAATSDQRDRGNDKDKVSSRDRDRSRDHDRRDRDRRNNDRRDRDRRDGNRFKFNFELNLPRYYDEECFWETRTVFRNGRFTRIVVCVDNWN